MLGASRTFVVDARWKRQIYVPDGPLGGRGSRSKLWPVVFGGDLQQNTKTTH